MSTTNLTDEETKQADTLLKALAEAKCPECHNGNHGQIIASDGRPVNCPTCYGSGLDPHAELFRVTCEHFTHYSDHSKTCPAEDCKEHRASCTGTRPLTPAEANAKGLEMLEWLFKDGHEELFWDGWDVQDMPLLLAILSAIASAVGLVVNNGD